MSRIAWMGGRVAPRICPKRECLGGIPAGFSLGLTLDLPHEDSRTWLCSHPDLRWWFNRLQSVLVGSDVGCALIAVSSPEPQSHEGYGKVCLPIATSLLGGSYAVHAA